MTVKDKLPAGSPLGFGNAPLGNMFRAIPDAEAAATVRAAWEQGPRFFDTAPFYVAGIDIAFVHDVAEDFHGDEWLARFEEARRDAFRAILPLRGDRCSTTL